VRLGNVDLDFEQVQSNRRGIVDGVVKGLAGLLKGNGIKVVQGHGRFSGPNTLAVEGGEDITFKSAVIATGSRPAAPPIPGIDHPRCIDSTGALELDAVPQRLAVLGGGVIGVEFASIYAQFGSAVTVVEMLPNLIGNEDADAVAGLQRAFRRRGIAVELGARATGVEETDGNLSLRYETAEGENKLLEADVVLVATGRVANVEDVGLEAAGVAAERRRIPVDSHMRTNVPHIYAAGDVAGNWQLAHTAFREGEVAAENALGHASEIDYRSTPRCVYTDPEVASVGLSEAQARELHGDQVVAGTMPYAAIARAAMYGDRTGFVKVIGESRYGEFLGMVAVGTQATELIEAGVVAIEAEATLETVGDSIAAHPTLGEATKEAALVALGRPLHIPAKR
jgi:dihydrolipoamide dehydrogenase